MRCIFPILKGEPNNEVLQFPVTSSTSQASAEEPGGSLATSTNTSASSSFPCAWLCGGEPVPFLGGNGSWKREGR